MSISTVQVSGLPETSEPSLSSVIPIQDGTTLKKITLANLKTNISQFGKHYTARWNMTTAQCERLNDAAGITTSTANFGHFGSVNSNYSNPFDSIYPWSGRKLCNIDLEKYRSLNSGADITDCVTYWEGESGFSYSGQYGVWVYTPPFYGRSWIEGSYRYFDITDVNEADYLYYPASIVGRWLGRDVTLTIDGTSKHCNLPTTGMPMANVSMANMHTYAKNWNASLMDIYAIDALSMLYIVEYANMNLQDAIGYGVSNLYAQSLRVSANVTSSNTITLTATNANCVVGAIVDIGTSDGGFNVARTYITAVNGATLTLADAVTVTTAHYVSIHGLINVADAAVGSKSGYIGTDTKCNAYYRGQTFYANKYQYILGVYRETGTGNVWLAKQGDTDNYDALNTSVHIDTGIALTQTSGWIQSLGVCRQLGFAPFCTAVGGSSSNPVGDYIYVPSLATANTVLLLGGGADCGTLCGWCGGWNNTSGNSYWSLGSCPRLLNP